MTLPADFEELTDLVWALANDRLDGPAANRLEDLLAATAANRRVYIELMDQFASLEWEKGNGCNDHASSSSSRQVLGASVPSDPVMASAIIAACPTPDIPAPRSPYFIDTSLPSPFPPPRYAFIDSPWFAFLLAGVIVGVGLAIAAMWKMPDYSQMASSRSMTDALGDDDSETDTDEQPSLSDQAGLSATSFPPLVGQITGMVDCQWSDPQTEAFNGASIPLGRKYALASGLMEITYATGARVLLQGPCTYEVESETGGYLSLGKLTAKLEKKNTNSTLPSDGRGAGAEGSGDVNSSLPTTHYPLSTASPLSPLHSPLFTIKTPTATVTDLGTEFGVEATESGATATHVFHGTVDVRPRTRKGQPSGSTIRLHENESVQVASSQDGVNAVMEVRRESVDPATFVRVDQLPKLAEDSRLAPLRRWQAHSQELRKDPALVAYYTFEKAGKDSWLLPNMAAATGAALDATIEGPLWTSGRLPGKLALRFRGSGADDKVILPEQERFTFTEPFSIAVWFQAAPFRPGAIPSLIAKGATAWRIQRYGDNTNWISASTNVQMINGQHYNLPQPQTEVTDGRWHQVVLVIEPSETSHRKRLYMDGRLDGEVEVPAPLERNDDPVWLGRSSVYADREFEGRIDEVAILARALSDDEIEAMYNAGNPVAVTRATEK